MPRKKAQDLTGQVFYSWTVIAQLDHRFVLAQCVCGNKKQVERSDLIAGRTRQCIICRRAHDICGQTFGAWTALRPTTGALWLCRCQCGTEKEQRYGDLVSGKSKQCRDCFRSGLRQKRTDYEQ